MLSSWSVLNHCQLYLSKENGKNEICFKLLQNMEDLKWYYRSSLSHYGENNLIVYTGTFGMNWKFYMQSRIPMLYYLRRLYKHLTLLESSCAWATCWELHAPLAHYYKWRLRNFSEARLKDDKKEGILGETAGHPKPTMSQVTFSRRFKVRVSPDPVRLCRQPFGYLCPPQHQTL